MAEYFEDDQREEDGGYTEADLKRIGATWLDRIKAAEKREDRWMKAAEKAEQAYLADDENGQRAPEFNILYSNIETVVPSVYNSTPAPDIRPRHGVDDAVAKVVCDIMERAIAAQIDDNALDREIEDMAQDAFLAGRGVVRVRFDADEVPAEMAIQIVLDEDGNEVEEEVEISPAGLTNERVIYENVSWRDYREGPAKRWRDVPWVCYRHEVSEEERRRIEDPELMAKQPEYETKEEDLDCTIWEIWCKETGRVYMVIEESGHVISIQEDPLGLSGFFPQAEPVQPIGATGKRCPVNPYSIYKTLAEELNTATRRINAIMKGLKVRGIIAGDATVAETLSTLGDWELGSVANIENLAATGGLDKAIMWAPVDKAIAVLQQLYVEREQTKAAIYEITGLSDIIRGQSEANETATAQQIKTQWGSVRIQKLQRLIQWQVRDLFKITAEVMQNSFRTEQLLKVSGVQIEPEQEQPVLQMLQQPVDHVKIDVESDSTIRADLTKSRGEMAEFLNGTSTFIATMAPIAEQAPQAVGPMLQMYAAFARQFNLGKSAEDALDQVTQMADQAGQETEESPAQKAQAAEAEAKAAEAQAKAQEAQSRQQEVQIKAGQAMASAQLEREKLQLEAQSRNVDYQIKQVELQIKQQELALKGGELELKRDQASFDALATVEEIEMEKDQRRAVAIGET